jgi:spermidine/putrescine transport system permease protein
MGFGFFHRQRGATPYLLLAPGMFWLTIFFLVPLGYLLYQSLQSGTIDFGYTFTWAWSNYWDAIKGYRGEFERSFEYAGLATLIALVVSYPVAYWIAFRGGRWKNLLLLFIVAPFFVTYLIRTLAWETILADHGLVVRVLTDVHLIAPGGRLLALKWIEQVHLRHLPCPIRADRRRLSTDDRPGVDSSSTGGANSDSEL